MRQAACARGFIAAPVSQGRRRSGPAGALSSHRMQAG